MKLFTIPKLNPEITDFFKKVGDRWYQFQATIENGETVFKPFPVRGPLSIKLNRLFDAKLLKEVSLKTLEHRYAPTQIVAIAEEDSKLTKDCLFEIIGHLFLQGEDKLARQIAMAATAPIDPFTFSIGQKSTRELKSEASQLKKIIGRAVAPFVSLKAIEVDISPLNDGFDISVDATNTPVDTYYNVEIQWSGKRYVYSIKAMSGKTKSVFLLNNQMLKNPTKAICSILLQDMKKKTQ